MYTTSRGSLGHKSHTFLFFVCVCVVGLVFLFFVAPFSLLAVFRYASAFNQDVSNWNMDAVTTTTQMFQDAAAFADNTFFCAGSTNTGSWPTSVIRASDFVGSGVTDFSCSNTFLHNVMFKSVVDDWFGTNARKTAVQAAHGSIEDWDVSKITNMNSLFSGKTSFDNDLSKWNTSAVTRMASSKCSRFLSPSLWPRRLFRCGVLLNGQLEVRRVTSLTRFCSLCVCVHVWWVWSFFSLMHPSLFLQCFDPHLCSIRTCPPGIPGR
jgi:surface protein